jgi:hypothetical protein
MIIRKGPMIRVHDHGRTQTQSRTGDTMASPRLDRFSSPPESPASSRNSDKYGRDLTRCKWCCAMGKISLGSGSSRRCTLCIGGWLQGNAMNGPALLCHNIPDSRIGGPGQRSVERGRRRYEEMRVSKFLLFKDDILTGRRHILH